VRTVRVNLGPRSYDIRIGADTLGGLGPAVARLGPGRRALVVADGNVGDSHAPLVASSLHAAGFDTRLVLVPPGEASKSLAGAARLYDACLEAGLDRRSWVVALGGGVTGDLAGFVAATFMRGLPWVQVPTTLLAQIDSSVGGKVGVDHPRGKNLIGAFHQPRLVWCDVQTLDTLPAPDLVAGLAEAIKCGILADARYYAFIRHQRGQILGRDGAALSRLVAGSCRIKGAVVEADEREETGARMVLNLGHTLAHAMEAVAGYGVLRHGEAVSVGLVAAGALALRRGIWGKRWQAGLEQLLAGVGLPTRIPGLAAKDLLAAMRLDKKQFDGRIHWILPVRPGEVTVAPDVGVDEVENVLVALGAER
jgi:3-dehydroquinate synthase